MGYAIYWSKNNSNNSLLNQISESAAVESFHELQLENESSQSIQTNSIEWSWLSSILEGNTDRHIDLDSDDLNHCFA